MKKNTENTAAEEKSEKKETVAKTEAKVSEIAVEGKVGGMLKDSRLKKGYKISDAAKDLCIRQSYLEAIEASNYDEIPEFPYGVGFIRSYADYLGLNSARIVQLYKEETDAASRNEKYFVLEPQTEASVPNKKYLMISLAALIAIYFAWFLFNEQQNGTEEQDVNAVEDVVETGELNTTEMEYPLQVEDFVPAEDVAVSESETTENMVVIDTTIQTGENNGQVTVNEGSFVEETVSVPAAETKPENAVKTEEKKNVVNDKGIVIKVKKETWIEVKDDKKLYLSKVLNEGDSYTVPEGKGMILSVGKYEGVDVFVNGKQTDVVKPNKKMNISLDQYLEANH